MDSATLLVRTPSEQVTLAGDRTVVVGRARDADVVVNHPRVSRRHLALEPGRDGWLAKDISVNGVFQDGQKVASVRVGTSPVRLHLGAANGPELVLTALVAAAPPPPRVEPGIDELETRLAPAGAPAA
ncbi:MAG: FHA domain-containing protein, partial [Frankia sp.]|nr:FHA domain-containing protein [Frankia sp.]